MNAKGTKQSKLQFILTTAYQKDQQDLHYKEYFTLTRVKIPKQIRAKGTQTSDIQRVYLDA